MRQGSWDRCGSQAHYLRRPQRRGGSESCVSRAPVFRGLPLGYRMGLPLEGGRSCFLRRRLGQGLPAGTEVLGEAWTRRGWGSTLCERPALLLWAGLRLSVGSLRPAVERGAAHQLSSEFDFSPSPAEHMAADFFIKAGFASLPGPA